MLSKYYGTQPQVYEMEEFIFSETMVCHPRSRNGHHKFPVVMPIDWAEV